MCECTAGWGGATCATNIDKCAGQTCPDHSQQSNKAPTIAGAVAGVVVLLVLIVLFLRFRKGKAIPLPLGVGETDAPLPASTLTSAGLTAETRMGGPNVPSRSAAAGLVVQPVRPYGSDTSNGRTQQASIYAPPLAPPTPQAIYDDVDEDGVAAAGVGTPTGESAHKATGVPSASGKHSSAGNNVYDTGVPSASGKRSSAGNNSAAGNNVHDNHGHVNAKGLTLPSHVAYSGYSVNTAGGNDLPVYANAEDIAQAKRPDASHQNVITSYNGNHAYVNIESEYEVADAVPTDELVGSAPVYAVYAAAVPGTGGDPTYAVAEAVNADEFC